MPACPHCGQRLPLGRLGDSSCPTCGESLTADDASLGKPIAQFPTAAEAGYFADVLQGNQIDAVVYQHQDYSAMDGVRSTVFVLLVPAGEVEPASQLIRQELQGDPLDPTEVAFHSDELAERIAPDPLRWWQPVAVVLVAGGIAIWAGNTIDAARTPPKPPTGRLWDLLSEFDQPLEGRDQRSPAARRIRYDQATSRLIIEDDCDGDGHYEHRQTFAHPGK